MPQPGDLLLVRGQGPIERTIEFCTSSPYSHVATLTPSGELVEAKEFAKVRIVPVDTYPDADWFRVQCSPQKRLQAVAWALKRVGQPYGWGDITHDWNRPLVGADLLRRTHLQPLDCSCLVAWAFQQAGVQITRRPYPSPADLYFSPVLQPLKQRESL